MAFDFPSSPTLNQQITGPNGTIYVWDNTKWVSGVLTGGYAPLASPAFTGIPTAPTATAGTNTTQLATTAFVTGAIPLASSTTPAMDGAAAIGVGTTWARADHVHPIDTSRAPLASPTFTGTPGAPTATAGTNTTQLATTAFVSTAITNAAVPAPSSTTPVMDGTAAVGVGTTYARADHVHASDTSRLALTGGTMTGTLTMSNAAGFSIISTAANSLQAQGAIQCWTGITLGQGTTNAGNITLNAAANNYRRTTWQTAGVARWTLDIFGTESGSNAGANWTLWRFDDSGANIGQVFSASRVDGLITVAGDPTTALGIATKQYVDLRAPLASPTFTGTPAAPTAAVNTNTTQIATTAFVLGQASSTTPVMDGTATIGTGTTWARADHIHPTDTSRAPLASPTFTGTTTVNALQTTAAPVETSVAMGANNIDLSAGTLFTKTISGATTFTVSNVAASGKVASFILELTNGGSATITWWSGMKWAGGTAPTLIAAGLDSLGFYTNDGGTTWRGILLAGNLK